MTKKTSLPTRHFDLRRPVACVAALMPLLSLAQAADFYIAPQGKDSNPGTRDKPFATLEAARDAIRALRTGEADQTVRHTVLLHGGVYPRTKTFELDQRDSFTTYKPVQPDDDVSLLGGVEIPMRAVKPVTDPAVLNRVIEKAARPHLRQIDLKALGITEYGELGPRGFRRAYIPAPMELFIDGHPMQIARWPNTGEKHIPMGKVTAKGSTPRTKDYSMKPGTFEYGVDRPDQWTQARDFYVSGLFCWGYADDTIKVAKLDPDKGTFTTTLPHLYGFANKSFTKWYALNLLEEIDVPGEYYIDKVSGILYFYPPKSFSSKSKLYVSSLDKVMVAIGNAENVRFENLTLEITRDAGIYIEEGKNNVIAGCTLRNLGSLAIQLGQGIKPFPEGKHDGCGFKADDQPGVPASRIMGSWHEHIYRFTAWDRKAGTGHRIVSCDIYDTGSGGIMLGGGDRKTLTPGNNAVENCDIYRVNRWDRTYKAQINVDGCGNKILNNHLHDAPGLAIYLHGNNHVIEYNEIDHVLTDMSDMGAIYMGRDPSETGNSFSYNFFHNIKNYHKGGHGVQAIFFDDYSIDGASVVGNVFYKAGSNGSIKFNKGGACDIIDNVFVDGPAPVIGGGNNTGRVRGFMNGGLGQERLLKQVNITQPPYSEKYPRLLATYKEELPVITKPLRSLVAKASDPRFVDGAKLNFAFKDITAIQKQLPGFKPIPFAKIGLKTDEYRTALPPSSPLTVSPSPVLVADYIKTDTMYLSLAQAADFYIAPQGKDSNPGTRDKPFATLEAARDAIRALDKSAKAEGVTVWIGAGTYVREQSFELDERDSGTKNGPIIYRAAEGASVSLMGGRNIPASAFKPVTDPAIIDRLEPSAVGKVLQVDLKALGITDYGSTTGRVKNQMINGSMLSKPSTRPELFFNHEALPVSVWPNTGFAKYGKVIEKGSVPRFGDNSNRPGTIVYSGTRPERWTKAEHIFIHGYFAYDWFDDTLKVATLDTEQKRITFTTPHQYGMKANKRYRVLGLLEEIDQPGEWMIEHKTGTLYLYPPADMAKGEFVLSVLETPLIQMTGTAHITVRGLTLETTRGVCVEIAGGTDNLIAGCTLRNNGGAGVVIQPIGFNTPDPGRLHQFPEETGDALKDGRRNGVVDCILYNIGTTGISLIGGNRKTLDPGGHYAINNDIHHYARIQRANQPAINMNGVGLRAAHNFIHDAPHVGLDYSGNDHLIEYNELTRVCQETGDVGVIYSGRNWTYRGNVVRYNFIHDINAPGHYGAMAVYLDDACSSTHIYGNIFYKAQKAAFIGGGRDNVVENNIFVDNALAVHIDNRSEGWANKYQKPGGDHRMYEKLKDVNHDQPPYSTRYPKLATILQENPHKPLGNKVLNNICLRSRWVAGPKKYLQFGDNLVTTEAPGFVDIKGKDFSLKNLAAIQKQLPGFKPIPLEKIGLQEDEYRR